MGELYNTILIKGMGIYNMAECGTVYLQNSDVIHLWNQNILHSCKFLSPVLVYMRLYLLCDIPLA